MFGKPVQKMPVLKKQIISDNLLIIFILLSAVALRFYNYPNLFVHFDEFSAFFRTGFDSFKELIQKGVVETDTHPAGVQVFLNYWVALFGTNMMLFKLPFVLMGIVTIYFVFKTGKLWFNPTVGLIAALFVGFTQYALTYTLFARPYASGLFFSVMMVWFWSRAFITPQGNFIGNIVGFILFGALCAYDHYFALFFLGLVWISGLFVIKRSLIKSYLLGAVAIFILFIPHLQIFFIQLGKGGVESWLAKPTPFFFIEYLKYILHFSYWMYGVSAMLFIISLRSIRLEKNLMQKQIIIAFWIITTYLVAYFYSIFRSAVLQYSVLLFTFPFLVMLIFSNMRHLRSWMNVLIVLVFISFSLFTLNSNRKYFNLMYNSGYAQLLERSAETIDLYGVENVTVLLNEPEHLKDYYAEKLQLDESMFVDINAFISPTSFAQYIQNLQTRYLIIGGVGFANLEFISMAQQQYPFMIKEHNWFLCDWYLFSKTPQTGYGGPADEVIFGYQHLFGNGQDQDQQVGPQNEFFSLIEFNLDTLITHKNNIINIQLEIESAAKLKKAQLVSEIRSGNEMLARHASKFSDFQFEQGKSQSIFQTFKISDLKRSKQNTVLKIYLWNLGFETCKVKSITLEIRDGNPFLYGLFEQIPQ